MSEALMTSYQQTLQEKLSSSKSARVTHGLARACMPHCIAVAREISGEDIKVSSLYKFVKKHGSHTLQPGEENRYYVEGRGWVLTELAEDLRGNAYDVVVQNLMIDPSTVDVDKMKELGRIRTVSEAERYRELAQFGGSDKGTWADALRSTLASGGAPIPTISIPKIDGSGLGGHGVVVRDMDETHVTFFDPDKNYRERYVQNGLELPGITQVEGSDHLYYRQPINAFVSRMAGEVMHVVRQADAI